ncbi:MAG: DUF4190 domain-containing protein [Oscillospiraceae bacterium]|jgi:hypothetical protein|nr:DUF4190 domain-containing protein [Oscillospiraceae bacterium]
MDLNNNKNNLAVAALVCGILGIIGGWIPVVRYFTFVLAILGIVLGVKARRESAPEQRGLATAGFVLGIIGTVLGGGSILCALCATSLLGGLLLF